METLIKKGIDKGLIKFDDESKIITYIHQNKKRNYNNPEEPVQAEAFLKLIFEYGYDNQQIKVNESVKMGVENKQADIIVYDNDKCEQAYIIVECKKKEISEMEFQEAIKQATSYAIAQAAKFIWITSGIKDDYYELPSDRPHAKRQIANIPPKGVTKITSYTYVKGGKDPNNPNLKFKDLEAVEEGELVKRFKTIHDSLYAEGFSPESALDEVNKLIFCKIYDEKKHRKQGEPYQFQTFTMDIPKGASESERKEIEEKSLDDLVQRIKGLYDEGKNFDINIFDDTIRLPKEKLKTLVKYLESVSLSATDLDSKGKAFETFASETFRGHMGAFFTPRNIVKLIVEALPIKNTSRVLDTSCGSGGFLLYALDKVRRDADEYYDKKSIEHYKYWHDFAEKNLYGIDLGDKIARTAKMNMILHDDGHTNVVTADGLLKPEIFKERFNNDGFRFNSFDFIITNPPFGSTVKLVEKAYLKEFNFGVNPTDWLDLKNTAVKHRDTQSTEILFIEQCYNFLTEGGYLAIVLPDGVLTNGSLQYVRDNIEDNFRIVAVVSLPADAFKATKAGVKSSVLFLKKHTFKQTDAIVTLKKRIENDIKTKNKYEITINKIEKQKAEILKNHEGFQNSSAETNKKEIEKTELFKQWKTTINAEFNEKINEIKDNLREQYRISKQTQLHDYQIFMAITEQIGYDATGKTIAQNDLNDILPELKRFIEAIEQGQDSFFVLALQ